MTTYTSHHFTIDAQCSDGGHLWHLTRPGHSMWLRSGRMSYPSGRDVTLGWGAGGSMQVASVMIDGVPVDSPDSPIGSHTFTSLDAAHTLRVVFEAAP